MTTLPIHMKLLAAFAVLFSIVACLPGEGTASKLGPATISISLNGPNTSEATDTKKENIDFYIINFKELNSGKENKIEVPANQSEYVIRDVQPGEYAINIQSMGSEGTLTQMSNQILRTTASI